LHLGGIASSVVTRDRYALLTKMLGVAIAGRCLLAGQRLADLLPNFCSAIPAENRVWQHAPVDRNSDTVFDNQVC